MITRTCCVFCLIMSDINRARNIIRFVLVSRHVTSGRPMSEFLAEKYVWSSLVASWSRAKVPTRNGWDYEPCSSEAIPLFFLYLCIYLFKRRRNKQFKFLIRCFHAFIKIWIHYFYKYGAAGCRLKRLRNRSLRYRSYLPWRQNSVPETSELRLYRPF